MILNKMYLLLHILYYLSALFANQFPRRPIEERVVTALGKHWHIEHFACAKVACSIFLIAPRWLVLISTSPIPCRLDTLFFPLFNSNLEFDINIEDPLTIISQSTSARNRSWAIATTSGRDLPTAQLITIRSPQIRTVSNYVKKIQSF